VPFSDGMLAHEGQIAGNSTFKTKILNGHE